MIIRTLHEASISTERFVVEASCSVLVIKSPPRAHPFINVRRTYTCGVRLLMAYGNVHSCHCMHVENVIQFGFQRSNEHKQRWKQVKESMALYRRLKVMGLMGQ